MVVTWDAVNKGNAVTLSNNNLTATIPGNINVARATEGKTSGKWYWEIKFEALNTAMTGIVRENTSLNSVAYNTSGVAFYYSSGNKYPGASAYGQAYSVSNIISVLLDMDLGTIEFWRDGISQGVMFNNLKDNPSPVYPAITSGSGSTGSTATARFNIDEFTYQPPEGYLAYDGTRKPLNKVLFNKNETYSTISKGLISDVTAIPKMTSDTLPSGKITYSTYHTSYPASGAFDGAYSGNGWLSASGNTTGWLAYEFPEAKLISGYSLSTPNISRAPKDWTFEGSNDGNEWVVLDTKVNEIDWVINTRRIFNFENNTKYKHFRVNIKSTNGDNTYIALSEFEMFEKDKADSFTEFKVLNKDNFLALGMSTEINVEDKFTQKNYVIFSEEFIDNKKTIKVNRKPLSIKIN